MNAYLPSDATTAAWIAVIAAGVVVLGYVLNRHGGRAWSRCAAWFLVVFAVVSVERIADAEPAGFRMVAIIVVLLFAMKAVVAVETRRSGKPALSPAQWLVFCLLWFGMRPAAFRGMFVTTSRRRAFPDHLRNDSIAVRGGLDRIGDCRDLAVVGNGTD